MNRQLYQAGIVAIPLRKNENLDLGNLFPNYLVFDSQQGRTLALSPNLTTGSMEKVECVIAYYKIVYREILEATGLKTEEFIERTVLPSENINMPVEMLPVIFTHQSIKENLSIVNLALSRFSFRGVLSNLVLEVDEAVLDEIIAQENADNENQTE